MSFHTDSPGSAPVYPSGLLGANVSPRNPRPRRRPEDPRGAGLTSPDLRGWDRVPGTGRSVSTQQCAAARLSMGGRAGSTLAWAALPGWARRVSSALARTCPDIACHQSVQRSRLVFKVLAFQIILRNVNDGLLNKDALVA